jgi:hypothetical protein
LTPKAALDRYIAVQEKKVSDAQVAISKARQKVFRPADPQLWDALPFPERLLTLIRPVQAWDICKTIHE